MKRSFTAALAAGMLLLAMAVPASAEEIIGPDCRDLSGSASYITESGTPTVFVNMVLAVPSCRGLLYSAFVLDGEGNLLAWGTTTGDGASFEVGLLVPVPDGPTVVCVYATTSSGPHVWDRGPDNGCVSLSLDPEGGGAQNFG